MNRKTFLSALIVLGFGCDKKPSPPPATAPMAMSPVEIERGHAACNDYQRRVCAAAEKKPALAKDCALAKTRIEGVNLQKKTLLSGGSMNDTDRAVVKSEFRKTVAACIEDLATLREPIP